MILMLLSLLIGLLIARSRRLPENFSGVLNFFCVQVSLPALVLQHLHKIDLGANALMLVATPWIVFALAASAAHLAGRFLGLSRETVGCLTLVCGTGNTSIVGIPLITSLVGASAVGSALVVDQSNFIVMCTAGLVTANLYGDSKHSWRSIIWKIITYCPIQMMVLAILLRPVQFPEWLEQALSTLGSTLMPLALISVAASFRKPSHHEMMRDLALGLGIKLLIVPAVVLLFWTIAALPNSMTLTISVLQSAMPPMIVAGLIAEEKNLNPALARLLITIGIPLSFLTVMFWRICAPF